MGHFDCPLKTPSCQRADETLHHTYSQSAKQGILAEEDNKNGKRKEKTWQGNTIANPDKGRGVEPTSFIISKRDFSSHFSHSRQQRNKN